MSAEMRFFIKSAQGKDGQFTATIPKLPGVSVTGKTYSESIKKVQAMALRTLADQYEQGTNDFDLLYLNFFVDYFLTCLNPSTQ